MSEYLFLEARADQMMFFTISMIVPSLEFALTVVTGAGGPVPEAYIVSLRNFFERTGGILSSS